MFSSLAREKTEDAVFGERSEFILEVYMESLALPDNSKSL